MLCILPITVYIHNYRPTYNNETYLSQNNHTYLSQNNDILEPVLEE